MCVCVLCILCLKITCAQGFIFVKDLVFKRGFVKEHGQVTGIYLVRFLQENWAKNPGKSYNQTPTPTSYLPSKGFLKPKPSDSLKLGNANTFKKNS